MTGVTALTIRVEPELAKVVRALRKLPAHELGYAATKVIAELAGAEKLVRQMRAEAVNELRELGLTWAEIAELCDIPLGSVRGVSVSPAVAEAPSEA